MKRCSKCGQEKPATLEYFPPRKSSKDGLLGRCRICQSAYDAKHYADNKDVYLDRAAIRYENKRESILERMKQQYWDNPDKFRGKSNDYFHTHRDVVLYRNTRYRRINRTKVNEQKRIYRIANPDAFKASIARSKAKKPDLYARAKLIVAHRRRARIRGLPDTLTPQDWQRALDYFGGCCAVCGRPPGLWHGLAMDHWIPVSADNCPGTVARNIIPLCDKLDGCNQSKGNKPAEQWLIEKFGKRRAKQILERIETYFRSLTE